MNNEMLSSSSLLLWLTALSVRLPQFVWSLNSTSDSQLWCGRNVISELELWHSIHGKMQTIYIGIFSSSKINNYSSIPNTDVKWSWQFRLYYLLSRRQQPEAAVGVMHRLVLSRQYFIYFDIFEPHSRRIVKYQHSPQFPIQWFLNSLLYINFGQKAFINI